MARPKKPTQQRARAKTVRRVGRVSIVRCGQHKYRLRWRDANGNRQIRSGLDSLTAAVRTAKATDRAAQAGAVGPDPGARGKRKLAPLIEEYADVLARSAADKHVLTVISAIRRAFAAINARRVCDVSVERLDRYFDERLAAGRSAGTINHWRGYLRQFFRWLEDADRIDKSPVRGLKPRQGDVVRRRQADDPDRISAVLEAAAAGRPYEYWAYLLCYGAGLRQSEALSLRWGDVDLDAGRYRLIGSRQKGGKDTITALQPAVVAELRRLRASQTAELGHPPADEAPVVAGAPRSPRTLSQHRKATIARAGLAYRDLDGAVNDWHAMRHTFCTCLSATAADMKTKQTLMRHSDISTTSRYDHTDLERQAQALARATFLPSACAQS